MSIKNIFACRSTWKCKNRQFLFSIFTVCWPRL